MAKLIAIAGLPGSGKTHYINAMQGQLAGICVHDFMANSHNHSRRFTDSRHYGSLVNALRSGKDSLIADIVYCDTWRRVEVEEVVRRDVPGVDIEWRFFENNSAQCQANAMLRRRDSLPEELKQIRELSRKYHIPSGAIVIPVWSASSQK